MKTYLVCVITLLLPVANVLSATPVTEQKTWEETYAVQSASPRLIISNIWGNVRVRPGDSGEITVAVTEFRSAPDQERFERSLDVLRLDIDADNDGLSMRVGQANEHWRYRNRCDGCRVDYQFDVRVPPGAVLSVGTVMDGRVDVEGVRGTISASNVNGPIRIDGMHECESIESVNGKVDLDYSQAPVRECRIETVNGDITLDVPGTAGLDVTMDLFNGDIVSDMQTDALQLPATVEHIVANGRNQYRIQKLTGLRIGAGGPTYTISSINGDVRIQKNQ